MVLSRGRRRAIREVPFDWEAAPKRRVAACNLCGNADFALVSRRDRYGFPASSSACRRCGLVFLDPQLTEEAYADFYARVYRPLVSAYHGRRIDAETVEAEQVPYAEALVELLAPHLEARAGGGLLDVGGSTGVVAEMLADRLGFRALVLDPAPAEAERAARRGLETEIGTIESYEAGPRTFDAITLCQTVDHLLDVSGSLAKLRRLIAADGIFFVDVVDFRTALRLGGSVEAATKLDHPYGLTEATARAFLAQAGFGVRHSERAADGLHVAYVCAAADPEPEAMPDRAEVEALLREMPGAAGTPAS